MQRQEQKEEKWTIVTKTNSRNRYKRFRNPMLPVSFETASKEAIEISSYHLKWYPIPYNEALAMLNKSER